MAALSKIQRIESIIFITCGGNTRTQKQVWELFNAKIDPSAYQQSVKLRKNREADPVKIIQKLVSENLKPDVVLCVEDNPQNTSQQIATDRYTSTVGMTDSEDRPKKIQFH